jgi:hypothetical protein
MCITCRDSIEAGLAILDRGAGLICAAGGGVGARGEARGGEGVGVVLLDPGGHLFADEAAEVKVFAGVAGAHEAAELHGAISKVGDLEAADLLVPERGGVDDGLELFAQGFDGDGVVDVEKGGAHDVGGLAGPVLKGVFDEVAQRDDEAAEIPDADDDVGGVDLFDAAPLALDHDDVVDADGFGEGDLKAGEEVCGGGLGCGGEDEGGDAGGGEQAGAIVPDAGVVEGPEEGADVDDDDEGDEHAAEELELGVNAAGLDVVFGVEVVAPEHHGLEDVDAADGEPSESNDGGHDEALADDVFDVVGKAGNGGQNEEETGDEEDGAGGVAEIALHAPAEALIALFSAAQDAEEDVVDEVGEDDGGAEEKDGEEPSMIKVERGEREERVRGEAGGEAVQDWLDLLRRLDASGLRESGFGICGLGYFFCWR